MSSGHARFHLHGTSSLNAAGELQIGGVGVSTLAARYSTPLYIIDEDFMRQNMRDIRAAAEHTPLSVGVVYASKALCIMATCRMAHLEGLWLDVVSGGELATARKAGFPMERIEFHGSNKLPDEISDAISYNIGLFIVDSFHELDLLIALAREKKQSSAAGEFKRINIQLRVNIGVGATETHEYINTGRTDSKFGFDVASGAAAKAIAQALEANDVLSLNGFHSHIGSQMHTPRDLKSSARLLVDYFFSIKKTLSDADASQFKTCNIGGGFGIRYSSADADATISPAEMVRQVVEDIHSHLLSSGIAQAEWPHFMLEPGRGIVGLAGTTLYTVGTLKEVPGVRTYVSVDGGMGDNIRPMLYGAIHECLVANKPFEAHTRAVTIAGRCCESGDVLIRDALVPESTRSGDLLAISVTGAYNYSMASNYNRIKRPAVVFVAGGKSEVVVQRESYDDITRLDVIPEHLHL